MIIISLTCNFMVQRRKQLSGRCAQGWSVSEAGARSPEELYRQANVKGASSLDGDVTDSPPPPSCHFIGYAASNTAGYRLRFPASMSG
ncbi:hypothetical protein HZH66_009172 [Vespula vulgaris]|uniref:Uncharacterized protein n=2 Tax=Vespula TaxID=7451 RepID=A0A834JRM3_VESVU|nr:hypothetical protein HZH66_009172 [Vespula vulgaris]